MLLSHLQPQTTKTQHFGVILAFGASKKHIIWERDLHEKSNFNVVWYSYIKANVIVMPSNTRWTTNKCFISILNFKHLKNSIDIIVHFWCKRKGHNIGKWTCMKNPFSMFYNVATWKLIALCCHPLTGNYMMLPSHLQLQTTKGTELVSFSTLV